MKGSYSYIFFGYSPKISTLYQISENVNKNVHNSFKTSNAFFLYNVYLNNLELQKTLIIDVLSNYMYIFTDTMKQTCKAKV